MLSTLEHYLTPLFSIYQETMSQKNLKKATKADALASAETASHASDSATGNNANGADSSESPYIKELAK